MKINNKLIVALALMLPSGVTLASNYVLRVPVKVQLSDWETASTIYGSWSNIGDLFSCSSYSPSPSLSLKTNYSQISNCSQNQQQRIQEREYDNLNDAYRITKTYYDERIINSDKSREVSVTNDGWYNNGSISCASWSPSTGSVRKGTPFTQKRSCSTPTARDWTHTSNNSKLAEFKETSSSSSTQSRTVNGTRGYSWVQCASEGGVCKFNSSQARYVKYGSGSSYTIKWAGNNVGCNNNVFGDPAYGIGKTCWYDK